MSKYLVKRVLLAILSILIVSAITFFVMNLIPGGPFNKEKATSKEAQQVLEERYNLDKPVPEQYVLYMNNLLHGDWGVSLHSGRNIGTEISRKFAVSAKLGGVAAIVAIIIGVILGSIAALTRNKLPDRLIVFFTTLGTAMPSFVLATLLFTCILFKTRMDSGMVFEQSELSAPNHCTGGISDGIYYASDKDKYAGCAKSGLYPYCKGKGCASAQSYF